MLAPISAADARAARERIAGIAIRTPLLRVPVDIVENVHLKLENLQPIGAFKIRGAANAMAMATESTLKQGVYTASAGNMAQGVAWCARERGLSCRVIVPDHAPKTKTDAIERLGGEVIKVPFATWWQTLVDHRFPGMSGLFIHPFADPAVMAGNGTIALEVLEDIGEMDTVLVPYGGGGLSCGIASVLRELSPRTRVYAVEVETAAPLTASLAAGGPETVAMTRTFVDGMGSSAVSEEMWPLASTLLAGTHVVTVAEIADAIRTLAERCRIVAEGAGAATLGAARAARFGQQRVVCIVSGGNLNLDTLATILRGDLP